MSFVEQDHIRQIESHESDVGEKPRLTDLQIEILKSVAGGKTNLEIARDLRKAEQIVKNYFWDRKEYGHSSDGIFARLNVCSRREAVVKAIHLGILDPEKLVREEELERLNLLSEREAEVLSCLADPSLPSLKTMRREIADKLGGISHRTVANHLATIYKKLGIKEGQWIKSTRAAVIFLAYQRRQESTSPSHERLREHPEAGGW